MRIIRRQRRRSTGAPRYGRRRQRCPENGINCTFAASRTTAESGANSGGAGHLRYGKMSDPMVYNVLLGLVVVAAVVSVVCFTTLTIVPRAVLAMGMMACIWNVIDNLWGNDAIEDE